MRLLGLYRWFLYRATRYSESEIGVVLSGGKDSGNFTGIGAGFSGALTTGITGSGVFSGAFATGAGGGGGGGGAG